MSQNGWVLFGTPSKKKTKRVPADKDTLSACCLSCWRLKECFNMMFCTVVPLMYGLHLNVACPREQTIALEPAKKRAWYALRSLPLVVQGWRLSCQARAHTGYTCASERQKLNPPTCKPVTCFVKPAPCRCPEFITSKPKRTAASQRERLANFELRLRRGNRFGAK